MLPPSGPSVAKRPTMHRKRTSEQSADASSETASASGSIDTKSKHRDRIGMACIHCRHRKIKCDGQPTCATCHRLKRKCEYEAVTEFQNMLSRDRKRRNKEIKLAKAAALSIFAEPGPRSMGPPSAPLTSPTASYAEQFHNDFFSSPLSARDHDADSQSEVSIRRRRGISLTHPAPSHMYAELAAAQQTVAPALISSISQPTTPSAKQAHEYYQALATPSPHTTTFTLPDYSFYSPPGAHTFGSASGLAAAYLTQSDPPQQPHTEPTSPVFGGPSIFAPPQVVPSSTSDTEFQTGFVNLADAHTIVPSSAHVRPVDLPAPHGHFDFATLPFLSEAPFASLRRRSSIHLPVGHEDAMRRPSVAEAVAATLNQRVADKRADEVPVGLRQQSHEVLSSNPGSSTGIAAWNAQVQSHHQEPMLSWTGVQTPDTAADTFDYVALSTPTARSNSDGLLSLGPLSPPNNVNTEGVKRGSHPDETSTASHSSVSSSNGDASLFVDTHRVDGYYSTPTGTVAHTSQPFSLHALNASTHDCVKQQGWAAFQNQAGPMLSPVSDLNNMFGNFGVLASPPTPLANGNDYSRQYSNRHYDHLQEQQLSPTHHRSRSQAQHYDTSTLASAFGPNPHRSSPL